MTEQVTRDKNENTTKIPLQYGGFDAGEEIARKLMQTVHKDLASVDIKFLCRNIAKKRNKKPVGGNVYKVNPMYKHLTEHDFIVEVALEVWNILEPYQRVALIDHLLSRISVEEDEKTGDLKFALISPEIQEFSDVVKRNKTWNEELIKFASNLQ